MPSKITSTFHEVLRSFGSTHGLATYFDGIEEIRKKEEQERIRKEQEAETERKRQEHAAAKKAFFDTFYEQDTPERIRARHEEFVKLKDAGVLTESEYLEQLDQQTTDTMQKAGVTQHNYNTVMLTTAEMKDKLTVLTENNPRFNQNLVNIYLEQREEAIQLGLKAGDIQFNKDFERDNNGETLKHRIENGTAPGVWLMFEKDYNAYLTHKELQEKLEDLQKRLSAGAAGGVRQDSPEPSGAASPRTGSKRRFVQMSPEAEDDRDFVPKDYNPESKPAKSALKSSRGSRAASEEPPVKSRRTSVDETNVVPGKRNRTAPTSYKARPGSRKGSPRK